MTSYARPLPTFVIIGAAKAGTTSLLAYLAEYPDVGVAIRKEVRYFDFNHGEGAGWYRAHFPSIVFWLRVRARAGHWPAIGESTPFYLGDPRVPARLRALNPRMKLIVLLREPSVRSYSHYEHSVRQREEDLPFLDALAAEGARLEPERRALREDAGFVPLNTFRQGYLEGSRYGEHVARWLSEFPRPQLLIVFAEDLFEDPAAVCAEVAAFLGVHATALDEYPRRNSAEYASPPPEWLDRVREELRDDTQALEELLGRRPPWKISADLRRST